MKKIILTVVFLLYSVGNLYAITIYARDPAVTDDYAHGYRVTNTWLNSSSLDKFDCTDATTGAAVWVKQSGGGAAVSDTAYDPTTWLNVTTIAPSKNALRNKIETLASGGGVTTTTLAMNDEVALAVPTTSGNLMMSYIAGGVAYRLEAMIAPDGTATVQADSDASGTGIEYHAAIADCNGLCLYNASGVPKIINKTVSSITLNYVYQHD